MRPRFRLVCAPFLLTVACGGPAPETNAQLAELSEQLERTNARLDEIGERLDRIDARLDAENRAGLERLERMREIRERRRDAGDAATTPSPPVDRAKLEAGISCEGDACKVQRALLDELLASPAALSRSARVIPVMEDGVQRGFKLFGMRPGTLGPLLGLENGDRVLTVNGRQLDSIDSAMDSYLALRDARELEIEIERRGQARKLKIELE